MYVTGDSVFTLSDRRCNLWISNMPTLSVVSLSLLSGTQLWSIRRRFVVLWLIYFIAVQFWGWKGGCLVWGFGDIKPEPLHNSKMSLVRGNRELAALVDSEVSLLILDTEGLAYRTEFDGNIYWVTRLTDNLLTVKKPYAEHGKTCTIDDLDPQVVPGPDDANSGDIGATSGAYGTSTGKNFIFQRHLVPSYDGFVYYIDEAHKSTLLQVHVRDIVNFTPFRTPLLEGVYLEGSRNSSVLALNHETGDYLMRHKRKVVTQSDMSIFRHFYKQRPPEKQLHVGYTDWTVRAFDERCHTELWSFNWREISSVNNEIPDRGLESIRKMISVAGNKLTINIGGIDASNATSTGNSTSNGGIHGQCGINQMCDNKAVDDIKKSDFGSSNGNISSDETCNESCGETPNTRKSSSSTVKDDTSSEGTCGNGFSTSVQFPFPISAVFAVVLDGDIGSGSRDLMNMRLLTRVSIPPPNSFLEMTFTRPLASLELTSSIYHTQNALSVRNGVIHLTSSNEIVKHSESLILPLKRVDDWNKTSFRNSPSIWERWWVSVLWVFAIALVPFAWLLHRMRQSPFVNMVLRWLALGEEKSTDVDTDSGPLKSNESIESDNKSLTSARDVVNHETDGEPWHESVIPKSSKLAKFLENGKFCKHYKNMQLLGRGGFGAVYRVQHTLEPGEPEYAVKLVLLRAKDGEDLTKRRYFREITANVQVFSRSIVRYFTWWFEEPHFLPLGPLTTQVQAAAVANLLELKKRGCCISGAFKLLEGFAETAKVSDKNASDDSKAEATIIRNIARRHQEQFLVEEIAEAEEYPSFSKLKFGKYKRGSNDQQDDFLFSPHETGQIRPQWTEDQEEERERQRQHRAQGEKTRRSKVEQDQLQSLAVTHSNTLQKWHNNDSKTKTFPLVLIMTMEMVHGVTLRKWLNSPRKSTQPLEFLKSPNPIEFIFFKRLMEGIELIHQQNFIHRDLKPENIFVDDVSNSHDGVNSTSVNMGKGGGDGKKGPSLKIGDFGLVGFIEHPCELGEDHAQSAKGHLYGDSVLDNKFVVGTPGYAAPESGVSCTPKVDIYSCALILLELLCPRFETVMERTLVLDNFRRFKKVPDYLQNEPKLEFWCDLMKRMIDKNPQNRPTSSEIISMMKQHNSC